MIENYNLINQITHYYDKNKIITKCPQVEHFSNIQSENQDTVKWWCRTQTFEKGEYKDYVEKTHLFEQYKEDCFQDRKKNIVGKSDFYKQFEKYYGLCEAVQIKFKNEFNIETKIIGYRYFVLKSMD